MILLRNKEYLRSVMFGIEDSLVSTTGLIAGIAAGAHDKRFVILGGIVAIAIEAVSMGAGEYLSSDAVDDLEKLKRNKDKPVMNGVLMFFSYFLAGLIPLAPLFFFPLPLSIVLSVTFALISLFLLGYFKGKIVKSSPIKGGIKIFLVGGVATILGLIVGLVFKI